MPIRQTHAYMHSIDTMFELKYILEKEMFFQKLMNITE